MYILEDQQRKYIWGNAVKMMKLVVTGLIGMEDYIGKQEIGGHTTSRQGNL